MQSSRFRPMALGDVMSLGGGECSRKLVDYCLLLSGEHILVEGALYRQSRILEIFCQSNSSFYAQQVDGFLVTFSACPSCQLDDKAETDDVYLQLAIDADNGVVCFVIA